MATSTVSTVVEAGNAKLVFEGGFTELDAFNAVGAGYCAAVVEWNDGSRHPVLFYDPMRIEQNLQEEAKQGTPFIAEPSMIVLPEVSLDNMKAAVAALDSQGFFSHLAKANRA